MTAGEWGFIGVVVGGLLTLFGPVIAEMIRSAQQGKAREAERDTARRAFHRDAAEAAGQAAAALELVYFAYDASMQVTSQQEADLREAVASFDRAVAKLESARLRKLLRDWQEAAENWVTGAGSQLLESQAFRQAIDACGTEQRKFL